MSTSVFEGLIYVQLILSLMSKFKKTASEKVQILSRLVRSGCSLELCVTYQ